MTDERLPQRFRYRDDDVWQYGICMPVRGTGTAEAPDFWTIRAGDGHGFFDHDPWEKMGHVLGDVDAFEWIDNDYGWTGDTAANASDSARVHELEERLRRTVAAMKDTATMPVVMRPVAYAAIVLDIDDTLGFTGVTNG